VVLEGIAYLADHQEQYAPPSANEIETALSRVTWVAAGSILGLYVLSCVAGTVRLWGETAFPIAALLVYHFVCYVSFTDEVYSFGEGDILVHMLENEATLLTMSLISGSLVGLAIHAWKVGGGGRLHGLCSHRWERSRTDSLVPIGTRGCCD
jgi:hypothetical protein